MSNRIIRMSEDIDQIVSILDGVSGSYNKGDFAPVGSSTGAASQFFTSLTDGQSRINAQFLALDGTLKTLAEVIRESISDHRAVESEISDGLKRIVSDIEGLSDRVNPNDLPTPTSSPLPVDDGPVGTSRNLDGSI